jgi:hypothetical protein
MNAPKSRIRRREFLRLLGCSCAVIPLALLASRPVQSQGKASKEAVNYQDSPKGNQKCSGCQFFTAPEGCQVVEGKISPEGWCSLYVVKQT